MDMVGCVVVCIYNVLADCGQRNSLGCIVMVVVRDSEVRGCNSCLVSSLTLPEKINANNIELGSYQWVQRLMKCSITLTVIIILSIALEWLKHKHFNGE